MLADESQGAIPKQGEIAQRVGVSDVTVYHTVKSYYPRVGTYPELSTTTGAWASHCHSGVLEARIISLACSEPPEGYAR